MNSRAINDLIARDLANAKRMMQELPRNAAKEYATKANQALQPVRPAAIQPLTVTPTSEGAIVGDAPRIEALPGRLPELVAAIAPAYFATDNIFRETYGAAKRLGIDAGQVRAHLKAVLDAARYMAETRIRLTQKHEGLVTAALEQAADTFVKGFK